MKTTIVGAGMAGCIAGYVFPFSEIIESSNSAPLNHHAVLRFRSDSVSTLTGIPFRKVTVHKAIWSGGKEVSVTPRWANLYSQKVIGKVLDRSIWNMASAERYTAPTDFHQRMLENHRMRIAYGRSFAGLKDGSEAIVSTIPLSKMCELYSINTGVEFNSRSTYTVTSIVEGSDTHCTVYYPDPHFSPYRATLTGSQLIVECMAEPKEWELMEVWESLGLLTQQEQQRTGHWSAYGKISEIDEVIRRRLILQLSIEHNIFSLGRFATWRNILLDDIVADANSIRNMIGGDTFGLIRNHSKGAK